MRDAGHKVGLCFGERSLMLENPPEHAESDESGQRHRREVDRCETSATSLLGIQLIRVREEQRE